ncbi:MAG TPA: FlgD immunoglobulin-like domain containing protein [Gaiellaceae bacterium]|nr:FlgD immunoglobulin-like domain containing protein [Gaiellaceae bacterium]
MQRVLTTVTLLGLLVATAAAFAITEHLKLIKSPVYGALVSKFLAPTCHCATSKASIQIKLRHDDHVRLTILDAGGDTVATIARRAQVPKLEHKTFYWDGTTADGTLAPDGAYRPEIYLAHAGRKILFPLVDQIFLDTKKPEVVSASASKGILFGGSGRTVKIHYALSERANAVVYLGRHLVIRGRPTRERGAVKWAGTFGGKPLRAGTYVLSVGALDLAGNQTPANERKSVTVVLRYIELTRHRIGVRAGAHFSVGVDTRSSRYTWRLGRKHGAGHGKVLRLRAPARRGTYHLRVAEHGHAASAVVKVRK